jgi:hypothetical protein
MKPLVFLTAIVGLLAAAPVNAGPILGTDSNGFTSGFGPSAVGWSFTTGPSAVEVIALDAILRNSLTSTEVRLYDGSGMTLAFATVTTSDPTETNGLTWNSASITPVPLSANTTYFIAEDVPTGETDTFTLTTTPTMGLGMTYGGGVLGDSGSNPTSDLFGGRLNPSYFGPNFDATVIPEPASLTLLGLGVASLAGYAWRRRR